MICTLFTKNTCVYDFKATIYLVKLANEKATPGHLYVERINGFDLILF